MSTDNLVPIPGDANPGAASVPPQPPASEPMHLAGFYPPALVVKHLSEVRTTQPVAALAAANQHREALTDVFLQAVERGVIDPNQDFAEHGMLFNYATYFLAKWREPRACPLFLRWFALPGDDALELGGDTVSQQGGRFLASVCGGNVVGLKQLIENPAANPICRGQAIVALGILATWGEQPRDEVEGYFVFLAREGLPRKMSYEWGDLVLAATGLEFKGVYPELRRACTEGVIPPSFITAEGFDELERGTESKLLKMFTARNVPITDVVMETRWWAGFQRNAAPAPLADAGGSSRAPHISPRKVGRNDPCPCGSGKKYKKCCGQ